MGSILKLDFPLLSFDTDATRQIVNLHTKSQVG